MQKRDMFLIGSLAYLSVKTTLYNKVLILNSYLTVKLFQVSGITFAHSGLGGAVSTTKNL